MSNSFSNAGKQYKQQQQQQKPYNLNLKNVHCVVAQHYLRAEFSFTQRLHLSDKYLQMILAHFINLLSDR